MDATTCVLKQMERQGVIGHCKRRPDQVGFFSALAHVHQSEPPAQLQSRVSNASKMAKMKKRLSVLSRDWNRVNAITQNLPQLPDLLEQIPLACRRVARILTFHFGTDFG